MRASCDPAMQCDPAGMASHHFENHDSLVTGCGRMQPIERIHYGRDGRIETERHRRRFQVVVDRFWNADAIDARLLQLKRCGHRPVAAYDYESVDFERPQHFARIRDDVGSNVPEIAGPNLDDEMSAIGCADDRSAARHDAGSIAALEDFVIARRQQTFEAVEETDYFPTQFVSGENDSAYDCVQAGAVAAARQHADTGLDHVLGEKLKRLLGIDHAAARRPLVVTLPAARKKLPAFGETIRASEHDDDQISRRYFRPLALLLNLGLAVRRKNQAITCARRLACFHTVNAGRAQ